MKSLVSAIALAAAVAFAVPAMAQAPAAPYGNAPAATKADTAKPQADMAKPRAAKKVKHVRAKAGMAKKHARMMRHGHQHAAKMRPMRHASAARVARTPSDNIANQLNRQEMQRLSGSSMPQPGYPQAQPGAQQPMYQGQ